MIKYYKMVNDKLIEIKAKEAEKLLEKGENLVIKDENIEDSTTENKSSIKSFFNKIKNNIKSIFNETKEEAVDMIEGNKKTEELLKVLPYMRKKDIHKLVKDIVKSPESYKYVKIDAFIPFLNKKDIDMLFIKALKDGNRKIYSSMLLSEVSKKTLTKVVNLYLNNEIDIYIDELYPYLNPKDVNRVVLQMVKI